MYSKRIQNLIDLFSKFPGIGPRMAARFVFHLTEIEDRQVEALSQAILDVKKSLKKCLFCSKFFEGEGSLCEICKSKFRNKNILCVVEKETDLVSIENTKLYKGLYFILGKTISSSNKEDLDRLEIENLKQRIMSPKKFGIQANFKEIVLGLNPTVKGEITALYLERALKPLNKKITRLAQGLPSGGELEYVDRKTLLSAFQNRK